ncbi:MAG TPA: phenylalanine--tRNA ligase subunit beta [Gemmatimonadaceae bacterium]|nr:phenylalanine--tRNA ligase subunit beta [Gemmatimonadaceae bacterium]
MNVSYEWLRALVPFSDSPAQLRDLITSRVATVDEVVPLRADLAPIVVARVVEAAPHPDSDHLSVTRVDAGTGELLDVVCGAPNVQAGKLYPFAPTGTVMPNGLRIERRKIRGAVSNGMLCSARELGLGEDHEGILELATDAAPGTPFLRALPVGDTRIVIDVMPNRPDLLSHLGVAREVAAATGRELALPPIAGAGDRVPAARRVRASGRTAGIDVRLEDPDLARRYMGVVLRGVHIGASPEWLVRRLDAVGSRSINNVVDATNYVLHELGQPTHAFDLSTLRGASVVVRRARAGEQIATLDGSERTLDEAMVVIADGDTPQAIAGIMGGRDSEVTHSTSDLFLEVASFDPAKTRAARRRLGMSTDASYRFERGVDPALAPLALERVVQLILATAGGSVADAPIDICPGEPLATPLSLRVARMARVLGEPVAADEAAALLRSIGFDATVEGSGEVVRVLPPSWRSDIVAEIDVIEEVARLRGYDSFPDELRPFRPSRVPDDPQWLAARRVRAALVGAGLLEARPMPFVAGAEHELVRVANPLAENEAYLRREVLESLARRAEFNLSHLQGNVRLFEIGDVFYPAGAAMPREELHAAALVMGRRQPPHFTDPKSEELERAAMFDEWDARALGERMAHAAYPGGRVVLRPAEEPLLWEITVDDRTLGLVRRLALDAPVWAQAAYGVELSLGVVESAPVARPGQHAYRAPEYPSPHVVPYQAIPATPPSEFDLALVVPLDVPAATVEEAIRRGAGDLLESLALLDQYLGQHVPPGHRSLAWRLTFRHPERTLGTKEIEGRRANIVRLLEKELHVKQRSS